MADETSDCSFHEGIRAAVMPTQRRCVHQSLTAQARSRHSLTENRPDSAKRVHFFGSRDHLLSVTSTSALQGKRTARERLYICVFHLRQPVGDRKLASSARRPPIYGINSSACWSIRVRAARSKVE